MASFIKDVSFAREKENSWNALWCNDDGGQFEKMIQLIYPLILRFSCVCDVHGSKEKKHPLQCIVAVYGWSKMVHFIKEVSLAEARS